MLSANQRDLPTQPSSSSTTTTSRIRTSPSISSSLRSLSSSLLDASITPWWSRISPTNNQELHDEVDRLVALIGKELGRRIEEAEQHGRLNTLLEVEIPALLQRYIQVWRAGQVALRGDDQHQVPQSGDEEYEMQLQHRARRRFRVYNALWPSPYLVPSSSSSTTATDDIRLSHERIRLLADEVLPYLLPSQELQSRAAAAFVRDLLAMLLRLSVEKGSSAWIWSRVIQKRLRQAKHRDQERRREESEIILLPSVDEMKRWSHRWWNKVVPMTRSSWNLCREYAFSMWSSQADLRRGDESDGYQEKESIDRSSATSPPPPPPLSEPSVSTNYLRLLCTFLDLDSSYSGRLLQGIIVLLNSFAGDKLNNLIRSKSRETLEDQTLYLSLLSTLHSTLLQPNGLFPPVIPPPSFEEQEGEYLSVLQDIHECVPLYLGEIGATLCGWILDSHEPSRRSLLRSSPPYSSSSSSTTRILSNLPIISSPLLSSEATWTRMDLLSRVLERVVLALFPEIEGEGEGEGEVGKKGG